MVVNYFNFCRCLKVVSQFMKKIWDLLKFWHFFHSGVIQGGVFNANLLLCLIKVLNWRFASQIYRRVWLFQLPHPLHVSFFLAPLMKSWRQKLLSLMDIKTKMASKKRWKYTHEKQKLCCKNKIVMYDYCEWTGICVKMSHVHK